MPKREMTFLSWEQVIELAEAHSERFRGLIYIAVDSGMCWSELIGLRLVAPTAQFSWPPAFSSLAVSVQYFMATDTL